MVVDVDPEPKSGDTTLEATKVSSGKEVLPNTGTEASTNVLTMIGLALIGFISLAKKKEAENK